MLIKPVWVDANNILADQWGVSCCTAKGLTSTNLQSNKTTLLLIYEIIITERMCDGNNYDVVIDNCTRNLAIIRKSKRRL